MNGSPISVTRPVDLALARVRQILFRPVAPGKWFVIGFGAWLAYLGQGGGGYNFRLPGGGQQNIGNLRDGYEQARHFILNNLYWILPLALVGFIFGLAIWVLFTWLHSRGEFVFLHCVALDRAEVEVPWRKFAREANSLFWFRLVLGLVSTVVLSPPLILCGLKFFRMATDDAWSVPGVLLAIGLFLVVLLAAMIFALVRKLTADFVIPLMYRRRLRCWDAWTAFLSLLTAHLGQFIVYFLFQIILSLAIGFIVVAVVLVTCCIAGCLLALPYLGTVLLLPVLVFKRSYSICYLAQYGPDCDVFIAGEPPVAPGPRPSPQPV
jgi:hypothetical protein